MSVKPLNQRKFDFAPPPPPPLKSTDVNLRGLRSNSSPLPIYNEIRHSGYVLSRISFRTILLKKWKQSFWIQYGPNMLLIFRSFADYDNWISNPLLTQTQRNFLVKLKVDFVGDRRKGVRDYVAPNVQAKFYGRKLM